MSKKPLSLYIHIPFCQRKCLYCDFCSFEGTAEEVREAYTRALCRELLAYAPALEGYTWDTVYFGGGTPSCLTVEQTGRILDTLCRVAPLSSGVEISSEVNPATADREKLSAWYDMGIRRLSVGVQSFSDTELKALGRLHTAKEAEDFLDLARQVGYENLSLDLMYAIPHQTPKTYLETLHRAVSHAPTHISAYGLKVEEGTPFARMGTSLVIPDGDGEADLYEAGVEFLGGEGYYQYEISNFARPGYACRHNLRYWQMGEFLGVGVAAYSFFRGGRFGRDRDLNKYLQDDFSCLPLPEGVTEKDLEYETVMLGLRTAEGISDTAFKKTFGHGFLETYGEALRPYISAGLARVEGDKIRLTPRGMYVSLGILSDLLKDF